MSDETLIGIVEIPKGGRHKYEYDPELGAIKLDRFVSASVVYPTDYGYVPGTLAPDDHVVCVPVNDPGWNLFNDVDDLPVQLRAEIGHFFDVYKDLDADRHSEVLGWDNRAAALGAIRECREAFQAAGGG